MARLILKIFGGLVLLALVAGFLFLLKISPGKTSPFLDEDGNVIPTSIAEIKTVNINGVDQKLIIRGEDKNRPVLLYIHGGPGAPDYPFFRKYNQGLEKMFVVVYWQQRGAAMSYDKQLFNGEMTISDYLKDGLDITVFLQDYLSKDKLFLMGHAWGAYLGLRLARSNPEHYHAYFGVSQLINVLRGEILSFEWVSGKANADKNKEAIEELWSIGYPPYDNPDAWYDYFKVERKWVQYYNGAFRAGDMREFHKTILYTPEYSIMDKINYYRGIKNTMEAIGRDYILEDIFWYVKYVDIPTYLIHGKYDYQVPAYLSYNFHQILEAPVNEFYLFENSAHYPFIEEKEKFNQTIRDILRNEFYLN